MSDTFDTAVTAVLSYEGGYANDPNDPGGETKWGISKRCLEPDARVLTGQLKWIPCGDLAVGDRLLAFDEEPERHGTAHRRRLRVADVLAVGPVRLPAFRISTEGRSLVASADHMWLRRRGTDRPYAWSTTANLLEPAERAGHPGLVTRLAKFAEPWTRLQTRAAGYLAGILDAKGRVTSGLTFSQDENDSLLPTEAALAELGLLFHRRYDRRGVWSVEIKNPGRPYFLVEVAGRVGAERLLARLAGRIIGRSAMAPLATPERVLAVEPIGRRDLVGLATSTRTVIVEGLLSHNSFPDLDIKNLTRDQAIRIYRRDYWDSLGCDRFPPPIAIALFDGAVNQGPVAAVRMLQRALGVTVDGVIGPETLAAARAVKAEALLGDFLADRAVEYAGLRTFPRFGRDWMRRLFAVQQVCLRAAP